MKGYTESPSSVEYNNGDDMLAKATNDVNGTTTTVTSAIPTGETTKSLKLSATGNKATANATIPISKADNPQKTLTIEYDTMFESADDAIGASRGMYAKTKEGNELWLTYFTASSLRTAITNTGGNWCYEQAMSIKNNQWHHIKLELHPNTGIFSIWLDGTMLQDNVSFVKEGSSFDTCKGAFDTLKEGITDLRFYHTASNNIENATYIDNVKVTEVSYSEEEIIPPAKIQEATPQISIDYINETLTGFESQEPYTIKVGEGNAKDITLGEGVTTISLDDEKIGYAGKLLSIEIVKKARNTEIYTDSDVQQLTVKARPKAPTTVQGVNATEIGGKGKLTGMNGMQYKLKRTDEWSSTQLVDTVEVDAGEYNVRKAATDTDFASEKTTITVETFIAEKEMTPEIAIDYTTEELINFVEDGTYTINPLSIDKGTVVLGNALKYTGKKQTQEVEQVLVNGKALNKEDYEVLDNQATKEGKHVLTIKAKGNNHTGSFKYSYAILPKENDKIGTGSFTVKTTGDVEISRDEIIDLLIENKEITANELSEVAEGKKIEIVLEVKEAQTNELIETNTKGYKVGKYLDITLYKNIDGTNKSIHELTKVMKVTIKVPEELINKDSKTKREYYIARSHNGKVDILETKYNEKTNSLTFETDKFSDYAILYKDTKEKEAVTPTVTNKETVKSESKKEVKKVKTGDNANIIGLMMLLVSSMFVMVFVRKKEN